MTEREMHQKKKYLQRNNAAKRENTDEREIPTKEKKRSLTVT